MDASLSSAPLLPEVLTALPLGAIVTLPDGSVGTVEWSSLSEAHVTQHDKILGRGPWIFERWQVSPSLPWEASDYAQRCVDLIARQQVRL
jgi:hypothetical protein